MTVLEVLLAEAIAHFEGFYKAGTVADRHHNPGNLRNWDPSLPKAQGGYDVFTDDRAGWRALYKQIEKNVQKRQLTLAEFFGGKPGVYAGYAPSFENPTENYISYVVTFLADRGVHVSPFRDKLAEVCK